MRGIFEEGNYQSPGGEFAELRAWLLAKLLWNPYRDVELPIADFLEGYYGAAAPFIRAYIELIHDRAQKTDYHMTCFTPPNAPFLNDPQVIAQAGELFDSAEKAVAADREALSRVRLARLPIEYVRMVHFATLKRDAQAAGLPQPEGLDLEAQIKRFFEVAQDWNISRISEGRTIEEFRASFAEK